MEIHKGAIFDRLRLKKTYVLYLFQSKSSHDQMNTSVHLQTLKEIYQQVSDNDQRMIATLRRMLKEKDKKLAEKDKQKDELHQIVLDLDEEKELGRLKLENKDLYDDLVSCLKK
jgi:Na+/phosphate symporter